MVIKIKKFLYNIENVFAFLVLQKNKDIVSRCFKIFYLVAFIFLISLSACDIINPSEQTPSFIAVDTLKLKTNGFEQGSKKHAITDCWVYVNNKLIGVFEVPFKVPVLESGMQEIQIEPGIKNSGSDSKEKFTH